MFKKGLELLGSLRSRFKEARAQSGTEIRIRSADDLQADFGLGETQQIHHPFKKVELEDTSQRSAFVSLNKSADSRTIHVQTPLVLEDGDLSQEDAHFFLDYNFFVDISASSFLRNSLKLTNIGIRLGEGEENGVSIDIPVDEVQRRYGNKMKVASQNMIGFANTVEQVVHDMVHELLDNHVPPTQDQFEKLMELLKEAEPLAEIIDHEIDLQLKGGAPS